MLTKSQKSAVIEVGAQRLKESETLVFAEFNGVSVENFKKLRRELKKLGADFKIVKKRLVNLILKNAGIDMFDVRASKNQLGTIFAKGDLSSIAGAVHKFSKEITKGKKGAFGVSGAYSFGEKRFVDPIEFKAIATLPSREVLLAQIAMMLTVPLKQIITIINEKSKQVTAQ